MRRDEDFQVIYLDAASSALSALDTGPLESVRRDYTAALAGPSIRHRLRDFVVDWRHIPHNSLLYLRQHWRTLLKQSFQVGAGTFGAIYYLKSGGKAADVLSAQLRLPEAGNTALQIIFSGEGSLTNGLIIYFCTGSAIVAFSSEIPDYKRYLDEPRYSASLLTKIENKLEKLVHYLCPVAASTASALVAYNSGEPLSLAIPVFFAVIANSFFSASRIQVRLHRQMPIESAFNRLLDYIQEQHLAFNRRRPEDRIVDLNFIKDFNAARFLGAMFYLADVSRYLVNHELPTPAIVLAEPASLAHPSGWQRFKLGLKKTAYYSIVTAATIASTGVPILSARSITELTGSPVFGVLLGALAAIPTLKLGNMAGRRLGNLLYSDAKNLAQEAYPTAFVALSVILAMLCAGTGATNAEVNYYNFASEHFPDWLNLAIRYPMEVISLLSTPFINTFIVINNLLVTSLLQIKANYSSNPEHRKLMEFERNMLALEMTLERMLPEHLLAFVEYLLKSPYTQAVSAAVLRERLPEQIYSKLPDQILAQLSELPWNHRLEVPAPSVAPALRRLGLWRTAAPEETLPLYAAGATPQTRRDTHNPIPLSPRDMSGPF